MFWIDVLSTYLFALKYTVYVLAFILLISGLDDLFIDICYWVRFIYRKLFVYRKHPETHYQELQQADEQAFAIMVPAWQEHGVVGPMAELAATTLDYENYHIFVGTYPNDPETQAEVDEVCARFPNVHKVVCAKPGPTSKADCLNNVIAAIFQFEKQANFSFAGFILHDAEDVLSAMELRLFNHLVARKDLIQLPVYPFARRWTDFTSGHYLDEFAELHGKDVPIREALVGQVPSAGVGTCFSRRAVELLIKEGDGIAFDVQSLTEDYDIGIRLQQHGMEEIFVRFPVVTEEHQRQHISLSGKSLKQSSVICIREYFPDTFHTAVRQKSRWIIGIVFQGFKNHSWSSNKKLNYFLWRDRKGGLTNLVGFIAVLIFTQLGLLWLIQHLMDDPYYFLSIYGDEKWLAWLLLINGGLLLNRMCQRFIFVSAYYGFMQGLLSLPRMIWGNVINFFANVRALRQVLEMGDARRVAWDKTSHDFPHIGEERSSRQPLGEILIARGALSSQALDEALKAKPVGQRLGRYLLNQNLLSPTALGQAVAEQADVEYQGIVVSDIDEALLSKLTKGLAWRYGVFPLQQDKGDTVMLASEQYLSPVSLAAISRKMQQTVSYVVVNPGAVAYVLKRYYSQYNGIEMPQATSLTAQQQAQAWQVYLSRQWPLAEILMETCNIAPQVMNQLLIGFEKSELRLPDYLLEKGVIEPQALTQAIEMQEQRQLTWPQVEQQWGRFSV